MSEAIEILERLKKTGHAMPKTRRDFLSHGLYAGAATCLIPNPLMALLSGDLYAAERAGCDGQGAEYVPFLVFDLAGGAALPGSFLVGKEGSPEDLLGSYDTLGWDPRAAGAIDRRFGIPMAGNASTMFREILNVASPEALANFRMGSICHFAADDTDSNKLSPITLLSSMGYSGSYIKSIGNRDTLSGGRSNVVLEDPTLRPIAVQGIDDVIGSVSFGKSFEGLNSRQMHELTQGLYKVSIEQLRHLPSSDRARVLKELAKCGYEKNIKYSTGVSGVDPRQNADIRAVFGLQINSPGNTLNAVAAAITHNAVMGYSGPGCITIGGCDYHTGNQADGDGKDAEIGTYVGRAVEVAFRYKKPLFFHMLTDGGCGAQGGGRAWGDERGTKCMSIIGYYRPEGPPDMEREQVGYYTEAQAAARDTVIGSDASKVPYAVLANYLNIQGRLDEFFEYVPKDTFDPARLPELLIFKDMT